MRALLEPLGLRLVSAAERSLPPVEENGSSLAENARHKAIEIATASGLAAIADDTGLEVDALGGAPGLRSARWAGPGCSPEDNNRKLLAELQGFEEPQRRARFRTVIVWALPPRDGTPARVLHEVEGVLEGVIVAQPRGTGGFGYDPLFRPLGSDRTLAEMRPEEKNAISHRGRALAALRAALAACGRS
ncbi:MAG: RdgB/HAM1 family non-canonical purine NTP pyrophosphatase [Planctomycetota bacterium]|nr:MAG: RdgB/HAM1 family non-canonical purine NTP pyrophosphatase [Planctomycetota bacterium]